MPQVIDNTIITDFNVERVTKNTVRFAEVVGDDEAPVVGTLYVQQSALTEAGVNVEDENLVISVTIAVASIPARV